jgi:hypothetical protein
MRNHYRGPSIDASYQVSIHLAEGFQRRRLKCEKLMDDRRRTPSDGKRSRCLWQGELKNEKKLVRSFNVTFRYIDPVFSLNNSRCSDFVDRIYPVSDLGQMRFCAI